MRADFGRSGVKSRQRADSNFIAGQTALLPGTPARVRRYQYKIVPGTIPRPLTGNPVRLKHGKIDIVFVADGYDLKGHAKMHGNLRTNGPGH